jgi:type I restriction enzyme R subunit
MKIAGKAKAMVVTSSRLHAVRYKQAIDAYIEKRSYSELSALVAFSGRVIDEREMTYTESQMNRFPESETADRFSEEDYQVLIVAEKFQTGFDQPLLHTMYVDKVLTGLNAVQTLSRLNRIRPPEKEDTFVLDFRNEAEEIAKAFEPYYGRTVAPPSDPNVLFDTRRRLDDFDVLRPEVMQAAVAQLLATRDAKGHGKVYALLDPAVERFHALGEEDRLAFKEALDRFVRIYSFLSQIVGFGDSGMERDYTYCRALASLLRDASTVERLDLGEEVELTHLRNERTFDGSLSLDAGAGEVTSLFGEGAGRGNDPQVEHLSEIVDQLNERFGLELGERDRLLFDQFERGWIDDTEVIAQARSNTMENFRLAFDERFMNTVIEQMDDNEAIFKRILDDDEFRQVLMDLYAGRVYRHAREDTPGL